MTDSDASAIRPLPTPSGRLSSTLFVTALAHGAVILGITFSNSLTPPPSDSPTLKVSLVTGPADTDVTDAEFLANETHSGSGAEADSLRPTTSISTADLMNLDGDPTGADLRDALDRLPAPAADRLLTSGDSNQQIAAAPNATEETAAQPQRAADLNRVPPSSTSK